MTMGEGLLVHKALEAGAELLWPTRCVGCELPGELLCPDCRESLPWVVQRWACPVCGAPFGYITCTACERDWETDGCVCALSYEGPPARMVVGLKDAHELRLAPVMAAAMATALDEAALVPEAFDALAFVPATAEAFARRGFDHMELVSAQLGWLWGIPVADVLVRTSTQDQRALGREERAENLEGTVGVLGEVGGLRILLADDVVTTGATLRAAARALKARGAERVVGCALARVW